ncbi:type I restriction enzyme R subunit [Neolewinella xylanilytica]|uniref:Type I restriction enzyme R subunit n=1 Tax=Neolewinella xylanilytica TaxID=1514080 RepID=A0A2S6I170_9BACT|nr:DEAD/DEAH box helicase family protein [Neolewinella xylanilytica]PPK84696.1 type I restriction enzyme R subunit [Neolewinella xylanilytica]
MSNFTFLRAEWPELYTKTRRAELRAHPEPVSSLSYSRLALEQAIHELYKLEVLELPYNTGLNSLLTEPELERLLPRQFVDGLHIVRKYGNTAAHYGRRVTSRDANIALKYLFPFLKWVAGKYSATEPDLPGTFDEAQLPKEGPTRKLRQQLSEAVEIGLTLEQRLARLEKERDEAREKAAQSEEKLAAYRNQQQAQRAKIYHRKEGRSVPVATEFTEAQTRTHLIDAALREAGWLDLRPGRELEYPVKGMPVTADNPRGNGFVDYVLWDTNGLPLALIEAKRTSKNTEVGERQARLYADALEAETGQRPVIFYTNGYHTLLWDDTFYGQPRRVYGFYSQAELQWLVAQRTRRQDIRLATPDPDIAGRDYQQEAIRRVSEQFLANASGLRGNKRSALLVMATGSGKTRTAAALVKLLAENGWVKRVLFLADRNALVTQAKESFAEHLPDYSSVDLTEAQEDEDPRLVFSTYPTMMNKIDGMREEDTRFYGVGHFDLIVVDEAHRSVYNRYRAIFEYFDALVVALTATPKSAIDRNTYELFGCSDDDPTFEYPLEAAIPVYLKGYDNYDVSTQFLREGIRYAELSEREKERYEEEFRDNTTGLFPEEIAANAMNKWLFNKDTVYKVLDELMTHGLKIEGGDKLGRTIIFAVNKRHAEFITTCFRERYPELPSDFVATVHNGVSHSRSIIKNFCDKYVEREPMVAVSVDMMDTGVDAPRLLNLVFFKVVRSYAKFWQMIGRGTRLCPDVYGPDRPKEHFRIFDVCQNFEFFDVHQKGKDGSAQKSVTRQIFETRLQLSQLLLQTADADDRALATDLLDGLHAEVEHLNGTEEMKRFRVSMQKEHVDAFQDRDRWNNLSNDDIHRINTYLADLPRPDSVHESARRFDLMMLKMQVAKLLQMNRDVERLENRLVETANALGKKFGVPEVYRRAELIGALQDPDFYRDLSQRKLDEIRTEIRELLQYLEHEKQAIAYTDFEDTVGEITLQDPIAPTTGVLYRKRVESFLREHRHHVTIRKLSTNQPITAAELDELEQLLFDGGERGTRADFQAAYGDQPLGRFVRSLLGLDEAAARAAFADFLRTAPLRADQMTFIDNIIRYLTQNGTIEPKMLFEPPFTDQHDEGVLGLFDQASSRRILGILREVNGNVG